MHSQNILEMAQFARGSGGVGGGGHCPVSRQAMNAGNNQVIKTYLDLCGPRPV